MDGVIAFGPVPSRRLGRSLGINNFPPKICTYACAYCQIGRAIKMQAERQPFYGPEEVLRDVRDKVERAREAGEPINYLTFVPAGEPVGAVGVDMCAADVIQLQENILRTILPVLAVTLILLAGLVFAVARGVTQPIIHLTRVADHIGQGDYNQNLSASTLVASGMRWPRWPRFSRS